MKRGLALFLAIVTLCNSVPQTVHASEIADGQSEKKVEEASIESTDAGEMEVSSLEQNVEIQEEEQQENPEQEEQENPEQEEKQENSEREENEDPEKIDTDGTDSEETGNLEFFEPTEQDIIEEMIPDIMEPILSEVSQEEEAQFFTASDIWINPLYENVIGEEDLQDAEDTPITVLSEPEYLDSIEATGDILREGMKTRASSITVYQQCEGEFNVSIAREEIFPEALKHTGNPLEGDYLKWQYAGCRTEASYKTENGINYITWTFTITYYTNAEQEEELNSAVSALMDKLEISGKSDYEKICTIYDYICGNVTYDQKNLNDNDYKLKYTAYAALINHTAVCQGYAALFYRLSLEAGVDCRLIPGTGNGDSHGWNIVCLNNVYYNLDATWDAPAAKMGESYQYFLKSEDNFKDHIRNEEYDTAEFHAKYPMSDRNYQFEIQNPRIVTDSSMNSGQKVTYDCIWYGSYPQSEVVEGMEIYDQLEKASSWDKDGNITLLGRKYHKENGKYFVWEPMKWRVLDVDDSGDALLQADSILNVGSYGEDSKTTSWYDSECRSWLNGNFLDEAFTDEERKQLVSENKKMVFVGDSYLEGYSPDGAVTSWGKLADKYLGFAGTDFFHKGGYGFVCMGGFQNLLPDETDESVTDVVVLGGWNDRNFSGKIGDAVKSFSEQCRRIYPNAQIHIGMVGYDTNSSRFNRNVILKEYIKAAEENDCNYVWGIEDALCEQYMSSDGRHPDSNGQDAIAKALAAYFLDHVSLMTESQMYETEAALRIGFSTQSGILDEARRKKATDYAVMRGAIYESGEYGSDWWLRTSGNGGITFVYDMGDVCRIGADPQRTDVGFCPIIRLNLNNAESWSYAGTFCTDTVSDDRDNQGFSRANGIITDDSGSRYYYIDGMIALSMSGLVESEGTYYYVENGKVNSNFTGIVLQENGIQYYIQNGEVDYTFTGIAENTDGRRYYIREGQVDTEYSGLAYYIDKQWHYFKNGMEDKTYVGIIKHTDGVSYYVKNGVIDRSYSGLFSDGKSWHYILKGKWNQTYNGYVQHTDKKWYYVKDGKIDYTFTGLAKHTDGKWYYANKGIIDWNYSGIAVNTYNHWYCVKNGIYDPTPNGLVYYNGTWYYINHGEWNKSYNGYAQHIDKKWYFIKDGKIDFTFTGLAKHTDNKWYYAKNGVIDWTYTGLAKNTYGSWYYVKKGIFDSSFNGLIQYNGTWYYLQKGYLDWSYTSLVQHTDKNWYYVEKGKINWNYTGLVQYYGTWYYVQGGKLNWNYTGLTLYYGTWYYVQGGRLNWNYTGLVYHTDKNWYYVQKGKIDWSYTSLVQHTDKNWYYVKNAKIDWSYTGLVQYYGTWYYVQKGKLNWDYSGLTLYYGTWYYVQNGRLNWNYTGLVYHTDKNWYYVQKGKIVWGYTNLVQHTDKNWYYVENAKINWKYNGPFQYYSTWYYIQGGKLNWNYNGSGTYNGIRYTVRNGYVFFEDQDQLKVDGCKASNYTGTQLTVTLTASGGISQSDDSYYILIMNSAGTAIMKAVPASISKGDKWQYSADLTSNDSFRDVIMAQYAIGVKMGTGYRKISTSRMLGNPDITASKDSEFKDKYMGYYEGYKITSKKGIQGASHAYTEDLGVQHVLLNVDIANMVSVSAKAGYVKYTYKGNIYYFQDLIALKKTIYDLHGWGSTEGNAYGQNHMRAVTVNLLLSWKDDLSYLIHPSARVKGAAPYYTLNMKEEKARQTFEALFCYMGEELGQYKERVSNWTLGNEVNSCNAWNYSGNLSLQDNVANYAQAFQILYQGVQRTAGSPRLFISLDHCWNSADAGFSGKAFLDEFAAYMNRTAPSMRWNVNYHPYSQPLSRTDFWNDFSNTTDATDTRYISMRNIQVLTDYLSTLESKYGKTKGSIRVILGETGYSAQGGNSNEESRQAAALGYGYYKAMFNTRVDAYIIRAYLDDPAETKQGLCLGLRRDDTAQTAKASYNLYKNLDTEKSLDYMNQYESLIGVSSWENAIPGFDSSKLAAKDF